MTKEMKFFIYLLENYAEYKNKSANDILNTWDKLNITNTIFDNYEIYHIESLENAYKDIEILKKYKTIN